MDRKIDGLGRVTIPKEVRRQLDIKDNQELELLVEDNAIILRKPIKREVDERRASKFEVDEELKNKLNKKYPKGTKVELVYMSTNSWAVPVGSKGEVLCIDDHCMILVKWENGQVYGMYPNDDVLDIIK